MAPARIWLPMLLVGLVSCALFVFVWRRRNVPCARWLSASLAAMAWWCILEALALRGNALTDYVMLAQVEFPAIALLPAFFFLVVWEYAGFRITRSLLVALFVVPVAFIGLHLADGILHWYWVSVWLDEAGGWTAMGRVYGPGFWAFLAFSYTMLAAAAVLLIRRAVQVTGMERRRALLFLAAGVVPWLANALYVFNIGGRKHLDLTPYAFAATAVGLTYVLFRYRFQGIVPLAWRTVVAGLEPAIIVLDSEDRVLDMNPSAESLLGQDMRSAVGRSVEQLIATRPELAACLDCNSALVSFHERGIERAFEAVRTPVRGRGSRVVGSVLSIRDVTRDRTVARELEESRRTAELAVKAKSSFLANMSHEIRTPMNGILGMAALLLDSGLDQEQSEYADSIRISAQNLLKILNDILDYSKFEAGRLELESIPFDLHRTLHDSLRLLDPQARAKGLYCVFEYDPEAPRWVLGDPGRLRQVILNLLGNAIKFTSAGWIRLSVSVTPGDGGASHYLITVQDTGAGIPESRMGMLFQEFSQADSSVARKYGGTGLGLAICKLLVTGMGGVIEVKSRPGVGSTFAVTLPLPVARQESPAEGAEGVVPTVHFEGARVLLAEDNAVNQLLGRRVLEKMGCQVDVADNGAEAIRKAAAGDYRMIFMDCQMPEVDGLEATRELRARGVTTPIVALTASVMEETRRACAEAGMNDYIAKPVDPHTWIGTLERWL